jgi:hypothetical protein
MAEDKCLGGAAKPTVDLRPGQAWSLAELLRCLVEENEILQAAARTSIASAR